MSSPRRRRGASPKPTTRNGSKPTRRPPKGRFGGLIASGWLTCAIAMRLAVDNVLAGSESFGSPGVAYIKWPNPVRLGDRLTRKAEVLETRRSKSQPDLSPRMEKASS
ncbi:MAG TPA: MaoC/PaaZ C-terminal domain-containing protein [Roseiarcus sp.]|nr:MaoC/PaaZ C-terminal domain-containing protein [Roseiarcus sp.]